MCGRFTRNYTWEQIHAVYRLTSPAANLEPRFNICPTTTIDAIVPGADDRSLVPMRWGLIPGWWKKKAKETPATFNARAETVVDKPMFRSAFKTRRCLIPASGYYEWHDAPGGKQPYYFTRRDAAPITIAGLWESWKDIETGEDVKSCAMIITAANAWVSEVHERMPVILDPGQFDAWLGGVPDSDVEAARYARLEMLRPAPDDLLQRWPVSKRVNSSRTSDSDASLIEALT